MYSGASRSEDTAVGQGSRRRKFAGYLRSAKELHQTYVSSYGQHADGGDGDLDSVPGSFPDLKVSRNGTEEMVLFPSYAKRHVRRTENLPRGGIGGDDLRSGSRGGDADYWKAEWEIHEDANAVVDVDVRGWIYTPQSGPLNRKSRLMIGIARRLSGIPSPGSQPSSRSSSVAGRGDRHEEEVVDREARHILQVGEREADIAGRGGYSEPPARTDSGLSSRSASPRPGDLAHPVTQTSLDRSPSVSPPGMPKLPQPADMSEEELHSANKHMLMRIRPFLSTPAVAMAITIFFFNDETSQSRTTRTNDSGHFNFRAALSFVPTSVRILASERLSASSEVKLTDPQGVSLISDIDDTVKHSGIGGKTKDIFLNVFVRELEDLTVQGVREWYGSLARLGVNLHYVSNSPWQLFPVLNSFFVRAKLPPGSYHLKEYSGMFQGVFEPVAERKRGTIDRLMQDFPERKFILVGDSGEADLEVYTETALMYPGRILGIFIRDVTTTQQLAFFDPSIKSSSYQGTQTAQPAAGLAAGGSGSATKTPPTLPPRRTVTQGRTQSSVSDLGDLIDFREDTGPKPPARSSTDPLESSTGPPLSKVPSPRPAPPVKPLALRTKSNEWATGKPPAPTEDTVPALPSDTPAAEGASNRKPIPPPPPKPRKLSASQQQKSMEALKQAAPDSVKQVAAAAPAIAGVAARSAQAKVMAASAMLPSPLAPWSHAEPKPGGDSRRSSISSTSSSSSSSSVASQKLKGKKPPPPLPPRRQSGGTAAPPAPARQDTPPVDRRVDLWNRRWARAQTVLGPKGVVLATWRVGADAQKTTEDLVKHAMQEIARHHRG